MSKLKGFCLTGRTGAVWIMAALMFAVVVFTCCCTEAAPRLVWSRDLSSSLQAARQANKFVLVDVYTDWCGWCKRLDRDTYSDPNVVAFLNQSFVCVKCNAEDGGQGSSVQKKYHVDGYPSIIILDGNGQVKARFEGYLNAHDFPLAVDKALHRT